MAISAAAKAHLAKLAERSVQAQPKAKAKAKVEESEVKKPTAFKPKEK